MLLEIANQPSEKVSPALETVISVLLSSSRDTDLVGWYKSKSTIGALFTGLCPGDNFLEGLKASTHSMSNILIRVDGDTARVETYWHVFHREAGADGAADYDYIAGGRYLDTFERRGGEWRILTRVLIRDWYQVIEGTGDWARYLRSPEGPHGSQKETDPVRALFGTLGGAVDTLKAPA